MLPVGAFMLQLQSWVVVWLTEPEIYLCKKVALTSGCENWAYPWCEVALTSRMWQLDYKESWAPKNWCFWTVVLEKNLESPLDSKEIQPVHPKGNQSQIFIGGTDAEAETPILWPPDVKNRLIGKDPDAGKDWRQGEKGMTEDEMVGMTSLTPWTWVWVSCGSWWWTGKPGMLQSMGSQRVGHNWVTELNWRRLLTALESKK